MLQWGDPVPTMDKAGKPILWLAIVLLAATLVAQIWRWRSACGI